jgi:hypothetical protein
VTYTKVTRDQRTAVKEALEPEIENRTVQMLLMDRNVEEGSLVTVIFSLMTRHELLNMEKRR